MEVGGKRPLYIEKVHKSRRLVGFNTSYESLGNSSSKNN